MHRFALEDDDKNSSYSISKDENTQSPRHNFEALAHSEYSMVEEEDREFHSGNSNQVKDADCENKLEDESKTTAVLKEYD